MTKSISWLAILMAGAAFCGGGALAMGSGGGGGGSDMPSVSAPAYDPAVEFQKGMAALQENKFREAARAFQNVTEVAPREANAWYMMGVAKQGIPDLRGATRAFERAIRVDPAPVNPHRDLAIAYARTNQAAKAQTELDLLKTRATTCNNTCPEAAELRAAIAAVEAAMATPAPSAEATRPNLVFASAASGDSAYLRAVSLINERRYNEALAALDDAETAFGAHPDVLTYKGYVWRQLGRLDTAESYYQRALAIAPNHIGATEYYGELKVVEGDLPAARAMLARLETLCAYGCVEAEELRRWIDHGGDPKA